MDKEQIRNILETADVNTLKDALAILLSEGQSAATSAKNKIVDSTDFKNFSQAISYLKKNYKFQELNQFTTEADLVYVQAGDRKFLLTKQPEAKRETRFSNLSYESEDSFFANAWEPVHKEVKKDDRAVNQPKQDSASALSDTSSASKNTTSQAPGVSTTETSSSSSSQKGSSSMPNPNKADPFDTGSSTSTGSGSGRFGNLEL